MDILLSLMGILHFALFVLTTIYVFVFTKKTRLDILFIIYFLLVNIHWVFFNGECVIAYIYKKYYDKDYKAGEQSTDLSDISSIFGNFPYMNVLVLVMLAVYLYNVYVVTIRNDFSPLLIYILIISYVVYVLSMRTQYKSFTKTYSYFHLVIYVGALVYYIKQLFA